MVKKTQKTETAKVVTTPAVGRSRTAKTTAQATGKTPAKAAASSPARRSTSSRTKKAETVVADRGLSASAAVAVEMLAAVAASEPSVDEIATRAYFIHLRRNGNPGNPNHDWILAIDELRRERGLN